MAATTGHQTLDLTLTVATGQTGPDRHDDARSEVLRMFDAGRDGVYRYARSFGLTPSDAEDVLQEVFLALFRHLTRGGAKTNLQGWVFRVTRNLALKRRAGQYRRARFFPLESVTLDQIDSAEDPEARLLSDQRQSQLRAVVRALPVRDQECLRLRAEGLRYREIASALGISLGSVANSLARTIIKVGRADPETRA